MILALRVSGIATCCTKHSKVKRLKGSAFRPVVLKSPYNIARGPMAFIYLFIFVTVVKIPMLHRGPSTKVNSNSIGGNFQNRKFYRPKIVNNLTFFMK